MELLGKSLCKLEEYCSSDSLEEEIRAGDVDALLFVLLEQETSEEKAHVEERRSKKFRSNEIRKADLGSFPS